MDDDRVRRALDEIEQGLRRDDPAFVGRLHALRRAEVGTAVAVVALLVSGAVLLTVGLATFSWEAWVAGVVALLVSVAVDGRHKSVVRRSSP